MASVNSSSTSNGTLNGSNSNLAKTNEQEDHDKRKLTKLHWKEAFVAQNQQQVVAAKTSPAEDSIWASLVPLDIDKEKLAHLFELKQSEVKTKVFCCCCLL